MKISVENEALNFFKTVIIVFASFLLISGFIMIMAKYGVFEKGYEEPKTEATEISYEYILAGTIFNRLDSEYYVVFDKFESEKLDVYFKYIIDSASTKLPIYKVNMDLKVNAKYASDTSNPKVQNVNDLKIKGVTLIKIKNGKNVLYLDNIEKIKTELIFE